MADRHLELAVNIINDVGNWATKLGVLPAVWIGIIVAGGSAALFVISGQLRLRGIGVRGKAAERATRKAERLQAKGAAPVTAKKQPKKRDPDDLDNLDDIEAISEPASERGHPKSLTAAMPRATSSRDASTTPPPVSTATPMIAVVDLDAFDANAADLVRRAAGAPIRVASKSRARPGRAAARAGRDPASPVSWRTRCARRLWLVSHGIIDDVLVGYPTVDTGRWPTSSPPTCAPSPRDPHGRRRRAGRPRRPAAVGARRHRAAVPGHRRVAAREDRSARRAPRRPALAGAHAARTPVTLAAAIGPPGCRVVGVMFYEAQVAGLPDSQRRGARGEAPRRSRTWRPAARPSSRP